MQRTRLVIELQSNFVGDYPEIRKKFSSQFLKQDIKTNFVKFTGNVFPILIAYLYISNLLSDIILRF